MEVKYDMMDVDIYLFCWYGCSGKELVVEEFMNCCIWRLLL